jgi:hypothetical protein
MVDDMPCTELTLALYMTKKLIHSNQDFVSSTYIKERCILPMSFFEQVCSVVLFLYHIAVLIRLQLAGALVVQAQAGLTPSRISTMVLTRHYARIPFGTSLEIELSRARDARFISITLHTAEATGLLAQVDLSSYKITLVRA